MGEEEHWRDLFGAGGGRDRAPDEAVALARLRREMFTVDPAPIRIGRLLVTERLGRGGIGVVYAAYDPELDRRVAVKVLHLQNERTAERALREGRSLARISHPNVVVVHGVEGVEGQLHIVMEYVGGGTLRQWLRAKHSCKAVLQRFVEAGRGLEAAHREGLIHGDFKPDNVLLGADGERARVADFGLATMREEATPSPEERGAEEATSISGGGTPGYAPPEQASGAALDARADQFSFCVSLYEALYGTRPFPAADLATGKLGSPAAPTDELPAIPSSVARAVGRGLHADPDERFGSMSSLLDRLDKAMRPMWPRYGALLAGVGGVVAGLLVAFQATGIDCEEEPRRMAERWGADRGAVQEALERTEAGDAEDIRARVFARADAYVGQWATAWRQNCEAGSKESAESALRSRCLAFERQRFEALTAAASELTTEEVPHLMTAVAQLAKPGRCAGDGRAATPSPEHEAEVARLRSILAGAEANIGLARYDEALRAAQEVADAATVIGDQSLSADALHELALAHENLGTSERATESHEAALWEAYGAGNHRVVALSANRLAYLRGYLASDTEEGEWWLKIAEVATAIADPEGPIAALTERSRGMLAFRSGSVSDAKRHLETAIEIYGEDHPAVASTLQNLATITGIGGDYDEALELLDRSDELFTATLGPTHPDSASAIKAKGELLRRVGRLDEAAAVLEEAISRLRFTRGDQRRMIGDAYGVLGHVHMDKGDLDAAEEATLKALEALASVSGEETVTIAIDHNNLALIYQRRGDLEGAERHFRRSLAIKQKLLGEADFQLAPTLINLGAILEDQGKTDEAVAVVDRGLEILDHVEVEPIEVFRTRVYAAGQLRGLGQPERAVKTLLEAIASVEGNPSAQRELGSAYRVLAAARADIGDVEGAREAVATARRLLPKDADKERAKLQKLESRLPSP